VCVCVCVCVCVQVHVPCERVSANLFVLDTILSSLSPSSLPFSFTFPSLMLSVFYGEISYHRCVELCASECVCVYVCVSMIDHLPAWRNLF
jgi:hypothetical protein